MLRAPHGDPLAWLGEPDEEDDEDLTREGDELARAPRAHRQLPPKWQFSACSASARAGVDAGRPRGGGATRQVQYVHIEFPQEPRLQLPAGTAYELRARLRSDAAAAVRRT